MRISYRKRLASHPDPELCGYLREEVAEALTGVHAGEVLSYEIKNLVCQYCQKVWKAILQVSVRASELKALRSPRPLACIYTLFVETGRALGLLTGQAEERLGKFIRNPNMHALKKSDNCIVPKK